MAVEVASAYVTILPKLGGDFGSLGDKITSSLSKARQPAEAQTQSITDRIKSKMSSGLSVAGMVASNLVTNAIGKVAGAIGDSLSGAISRVDILENFPRVMSSLGISSDDASEAINKMSDKLTGLPTTLDAGASAVQRFTSKNNDVKKSTDYFLALNNAILAGGAPTANQEAALEQLSQAYARGKFDLMEWRSLMVAMPAQMTQVASAFGMTTDELYNAMKSGEISMDDFMNKIVELNTKGTGSFASFEEQARNATGGIGTSISTMKSAFQRGWASIIQSIETSNISGLLQNIGTNVEGVMKALAPAVGNIAGVILNFINIIGQLIVQNPIVAQVLLTLVGSFTALVITVNSVHGAFTQVTNALSLLHTGITGLFNLVINHPFLLLVAALAAAAVAVVQLYNNSEEFRNCIDGIITSIQNFITENQEVINLIMQIAPIILTIVGAFTALQVIIGLVTAAQTLLNMVMLASPIFLIAAIILGVAVALVTLYNNCEPVRNAFNAIGDAFNRVKDAIGQGIENVVNWFRELPGRIAGALGNLGNTLWNAGKNIIDGFFDGIKSAFNGVKDFVSNIGNWIAEHKGPKEYDLKLLVPAGGWIMQGLSEGLTAGMRNVKNTLDDVTGMFELQAHGTSNVNYMTEPAVATQGQAGLVLNFYDTQTSPDAIYQKMKQAQNYGLASQR